MAEPQMTSLSVTDEGLVIEYVMADDLRDNGIALRHAMFVPFEADEGIEDLMAQAQRTLSRCLKKHQEAVPMELDDAGDLVTPDRPGPYDNPEEGR